MKKETPVVYDVENFRFIGNEKDFYANTFAAHINQHPFVLTPHRHNFYLCVLFTKGNGVHEIDFNSYEIKPQTVFTLCPGQIHHWKLSADIEGYIFFHTSGFFNINYAFERVEHFPFFTIDNSPLISLNSVAAAKVEALCREITDEYGGEEELYRPQKLYKLVNLVYIELLRVYIPKDQRSQQTDKNISRVRKLHDLIEANFKKVKLPKEYARMMNISDKHLNRMTKETLNKTISDLIFERIMLEAKRFLIFSDYSVSQLAEELGYADSSYFSRLFKNKTGTTPLQFLEIYRNNKNI